MADNAVAYNQRLVVGTTTVCLVLGYVSYALRLYARRLSNATFWYDDYLVAVGLFFSTIPCICSYVGLLYGLGQHVQDVGDPKNYLITVYTLEVAWMLGITTIKYSILLFYWRLFPNKHFRCAVYGVALFVTLCFIAGLVLFVLQCSPPSGFWDTTMQAHCLPRLPLYTAIAVLALAGDIILLVLPLPVVWRLKASRHQKIGLSVLFLLGSVVCIFSICRLASLKGINGADMTWTDMATGLWTMAEVQTAVVSANLPCMRPLYTIFSAKVRGVRHTYHSKEDGTTNTKREFHSGGFRRMSDNLNRGPVGLSSTVRAMRANLELEMGLPIHGISVITDVEQRVDNMSELSDSSETGINPPAVPWREPTVSSGMV